MKKFFHRLFGIRPPQRVALPSIVKEWCTDEAALSQRISQQWDTHGVQSLFQILETECAAETQLALADPASTFHAGGARALLNVLTELQKLDPRLRSQRKTDAES